MNLFQYTIVRFCYLVLGCVLCAACGKWLDVPIPQNQLASDAVFADSTSAKSALIDIYARLERSVDPIFTGYINAYTDELYSTSTSTAIVEFNQGRISVDNAYNQLIWTRLFVVVYQCNDLLEHLQAAPHIFGSESGTAYYELTFLRAYAYFILVNLYGDVPYLEQTSVDQTSAAARTPVDDIYARLRSDLTQAMEQLPSIHPSMGKARATKGAAAALLARIELYSGNWQQAWTLSDQIIRSGVYTLGGSDQLGKVFLDQSAEAIFQLSTEAGAISSASSLLPSSATSRPGLQLSPSFMAGFSADDLRRKFWTDSSMVASGTSSTAYYYSKKYQNRSANTAQREGLMVFRLAEQYLIRAEASAQQQQPAQALDDLNALRRRAGVPDLSGVSDPDDLLTLVLTERQHELFAESTHRFFDLKRTGRLDGVQSVIKPAWKTNGALLPIPRSDLKVNVHLTQNPGYAQ